MCGERGVGEATIGQFREEFCRETQQRWDCVMKRLAAFGWFGGRKDIGYIECFSCFVKNRRNINM